MLERTVLKLEPLPIKADSSREVVETVEAYTIFHGKHNAVLAASADRIDALRMRDCVPYVGWAHKSYRPTPVLETVRTDFLGTLQSAPLFLSEFQLGLFLPGTYEYSLAHLYEDSPYLDTVLPLRAIPGEAYIETVRSADVIRNYRALRVMEEIQSLHFDSFRYSVIDTVLSRAYRMVEGYEVLQIERRENRSSHIHSYHLPKSEIGRWRRKARFFKPKRELTHRELGISARTFLGIQKELPKDYHGKAIQPGGVTDLVLLASSLSPEQAHAYSQNRGPFDPAEAKHDLNAGKIAQFINDREEWNNRRPGYPCVYL